MRLLVTGGAGFIGSHLVKRLVGNGHSVTVIDNLRSGTLDNLVSVSRVIEFWHGDVSDKGALSAAMVGCDAVFHLAAISSVLESGQNPIESCTSNVGGTVRVLQTALDVGIKRVVFASSREVYGDSYSIPVPETSPVRPKNEYGASKAAREMYCRIMADYGLEASILRLTNVYGKFDSGRVIPTFIRNALRGDALVVNGGDQIVDFVYIDIVVDALQRAGLENFVAGPLNIGSGRGISIMELAQRIPQATGSSAAIRVLESRSFEVRRFVADISAARQLLNLAESDDALHHLPQVIDWWRAGLLIK